MGHQKKKKNQKRCGRRSDQKSEELFSATGEELLKAEKKGRIRTRRYMIGQKRLLKIGGGMTRAWKILLWGAIKKLRKKGSSRNGADHCG